MTLLKKPIPYNKYRDVLNFIKSLSIISSNGPWLAGGSVRKIYYDLDLGSSDFDIFCADLTQVEHIKKTLNNTIVYKTSEYSNIVNYEFKLYDKIYKLQLIKKEFHSLEKLLNDFDFTVCMFATDLKYIYHDYRTLTDNEHQSLHINCRDTRKLPARLQKYAMLGFTPQYGVLSACLKLDSEELSFNEKTKQLDNLPTNGEDYL